MLDEHPVARADEHGQRERDRVLPAHRDEHLVGRGRHPAFAVALGDGGAQRGQPEQVVAVAAEMRVEVMDGRGRRLPQLGRGCGQRGVREVEQRRGRRGENGVVGPAPRGSAAVQLPAPRRLRRTPAARSVS